MTKMIMAFVMVISGQAFAKDAAKKYNTHFVIPTVDERIEFTQCVVSGALISILDNEASDTYCCGTLKSEAGLKKQREICAYKAVKRKTLSYMEVYESKMISSFGEQEGGGYVTAVRMVELNKDLEVPKGASRSTLRYDTQWEYSEGGTTVKGKLPGQIPFGGTLVNMSSVDQELDQFAGELGQ